MNIDAKETEHPSIMLVLGEPIKKMVSPAAKRRILARPTIRQGLRAPRRRQAQAFSTSLSSLTHHGNHGQPQAAPGKYFFRPRTTRKFMLFAGITDRSGL